MSFEYLLKSMTMLLMVAGLTACGKSVILKPSQIGQDCISAADSRSTCSPFGSCANTQGSACISPFTGGVVSANTIEVWSGQSLNAGSENSFDAGTQPCACQQWASNRSNAYVLFNVSELSGKKINAAVISWKRRTIAYQSGDVASNEPVSCYQRKIFAPNKSWQVNTASTPVVDLPAITAQGETAGVLALVQSWADGATNNGIMFKPVQETVKEKSNDKCINELSDIEIAVRYR